MAKFAIACPACGKYAEARTGFFARKKIECSCGNTIDVRTDKLASRQCPHCGNQIVFDQTKGADAKCPVCQAPDIQPLSLLVDGKAQVVKRVFYIAGYDRL